MDLAARNYFDLLCMGSFHVIMQHLQHYDAVMFGCTQWGGSLLINRKISAFDVFGLTLHCLVHGPLRHEKNFVF